MQLKYVYFRFVLVIVILAIILILLIVAGVMLYNKLTADRNLVESAFHDIDIQLERRSQLIPNLISVTKGYALHEAELLVEIASERQQGQSPEKAAEEDEELFRVIRKINVLSENYPELKGSEPFLKLMENLGNIEEDLMSSRRFYNGAVRVFNTRLQSFPASFVGSLMGMKPAAFYVVSHDTEHPQ